MRARNRNWVIAALLTLLATVPVGPASAQSAVQLDIQNVVVSYTSAGDPDAMTVTGVNFGAGPGTVTLNGYVQTVTAWTPSEIVAQVSGVGDPGTYQLDVRRADAQGQVFRDRADVAMGTTGPRGPAGQEGQQGPAGVSGYQVVGTSTATTIPAHSFDVVGASCPTGKMVLGGGCNFDPNTPVVPMVAGYPTVINDMWLCRYHNPGNDAVTLSVAVKAFCAFVP